MCYWAAARLQPHREQLALKLLKLVGFQTYFPRICERRTVRGRGVMTTPPLSGYVFIRIELQWHAARWCPGIHSLVMDGERPAKVPDRDIADLRSRERGGLIISPKRPNPDSSFRPGDRLRVCGGPFSGSFGLYAGMAARDRVLVLLKMLGSERELALPRGDVASAP